MRRTAHSARQGFTLVELLVAMAVMITLSAIALAVVPDVLNSDRTIDAASSVRQWLTTAKARASRDKAPRGVRFLVGTNPNDPALTNPLWVTELQFTEAIPVLQTAESATKFGGPVLVFSCAYDTSGKVVFGNVTGTSTTAPLMFAGTSPQCVITSLAWNDAQQIVTGSLLTVTTLGTTHRVLNVTLLTPVNTEPATVQLTLDSFPQAQLGAAGTAAPTNPFGLQSVFQTTLFGISAPAQPLVGEPTLQLPKNICVDMLSSQAFPVQSPTFTSVVGNIDIVFLPSGQLMPTWAPTSGAPQPVGATSQMFLWVRDYTKNGGLAFAAGVPAPNIVNFQQGGEQQIVSLKTKSGSLGIFPVMWPNPAAYPSPPNMCLGYLDGTDWFSFARQGATSP